MSKLIDIVVSGTICLDILPRMAGVPVEDLPTPGRLFEIGPLDVSTGGAVSNTGIALYQLGADVRLMSSVGDDMLGQIIIQIIKGRDPRLSDLITVHTGEASSYTIVLSPDNVDRIFLHNSGVSARHSAEDVNYDLLKQARLFHMGYPPTIPPLIENEGAALAAMYRRAKATGVTTSMDMSMPDPEGPSGQIDWPPVVRNTLPFVDIFVPSINEIVFMLRRSDYDRWDGEISANVDADYLAELAEDLIAQGVVVAGFKLGSRGIYLHSTSDRSQFERLNRLNLNINDWAGKRVYHPAFEVEVVGTTGAGDAAYAGLLAAMLRGLPPEEAARTACAVGACNVEALDATSGIRTWQATQARLDAGWPALAIRVPGL
jgi:sugar/nucleoside kinase (ribokinase family)